MEFKKKTQSISQTSLTIPFDYPSAAAMSNFVAKELFGWGRRKL